MTKPVGASTSNAFKAQQRAEELASRLPPLLAAAERVASTVAQGVHGRRRVGTGETFWQYRRYEAGDATTMIDWRQSAKSEHVYVRENEWEAAQSVWLWVDTSPSMSWRSAPSLPSKRDRSELVLMALAVLLARGGERVALLGAGQAPGANKHALSRMALTLTEQRLPENSLPALELLPRYAQLVLIGDFLSPLPEIHQTVSGFTGRGLKGHMLQILDPAEETLPFSGRIEFAGLEGEDDLLVPRVEAVRSAYRERMESQRAGLAALARATGWTFATHRTDRSPQTALMALWSAMARQSTV